MRYILFLCLLASPYAANADVYEYIDDEGLVHLSDSPSDERYVLILKTEVDQGLFIPEEKAKAIESKALLERQILTKLQTQIETSAKKNQLDSELIKAVIHVESAFKAAAISNKGAQGLMQLMPATAVRFGVKDVFDSAQNIEGGAKYLRSLLTLFNNDLRLAIAAYNAGENAVIKYGYQIPPYKETQQYVPKVLQIYKSLMKQRKDVI